MLRYTDGLRIQAVEYEEVKEYALNLHLKTDSNNISNYIQQCSSRREYLV